MPIVWISGALEYAPSRAAFAHRRHAILLLLLGHLRGARVDKTLLIPDLAPKIWPLRPHFHLHQGIGFNPRKSAAHIGGLQSRNFLRPSLEVVERQIIPRDICQQV